MCCEAVQPEFFQEEGGPTFDRTFFLLFGFYSIPIIARCGQDPGAPYMVLRHCCEETKTTCQLNSFYLAFKYYT